MNTATIRQKLYEYIRVADEKKIKAIYTMVEDEASEKYEWWNDKNIIAELSKRSAALKSGKDKGIVWEDAKRQLLGNRKKTGSK